MIVEFMFIKLKSDDAPIKIISHKLLIATVNGNSNVNFSGSEKADELADEGKSIVMAKEVQ